MLKMKLGWTQSCANKLTHCWPQKSLAGVHGKYRSCMRWSFTQ